MHTSKFMINIKSLPYQSLTFLRLFFIPDDHIVFLQFALLLQGL